MSRDNEEDVLLSGLRVLLTLSVEELLDVQQDINTQLRKRLYQPRNRIKRSAIESKTEYGRLPKEEQLTREESRSNIMPIAEPIEKDIVGSINLVNDNEHVENSEAEFSDDTEDLILTQLESSKILCQNVIETSRHSKLDEHKNSTSVFIPPNSKIELTNTQESNNSNYYDGNKNIYSSPLKDSTDSFRDSDKTEIQLLKFEENVQLSRANCNSNGKRVHMHSENDLNKTNLKSKLIKMEDPNSLVRLNPAQTNRKENNAMSPHIRTRKKFDFNLNPLISKPWILEDFKPNKDVSAVKRGKRRLEEFYKKAGKPMGAQMENDKVEHPLFDMSFDMPFDNLRQRTDSPPGYGRLDFPTTQEREEDKIASKKIIYKKTMKRFLSSVNYRIPPQEREFLFKREEFNEAVNDSDFKWDPTTLKIYPSA